MSDKGGKAKKESLIDLKMILTAIVGVLLGAVFILTLILTGVIVNERYRDMHTKSTYKEKIADVVAINYETKSYNYYPAIDGGGDKTDYKSLLKLLGTDKDYLLIQSQTEYDKVVSTLVSLGTEISSSDLNLPDGFFYSGSLILLTTEMEGLTEFKVNSITRNEYYDLRVDVSKTTKSDLYGIAGKAILVKIPNIQPGVVEVVLREE